MRLHFFSSAVIANSKLDYWPKTTISWWHSHFKGCAMILCLNHGRDLWQRITGHVARLLKHPQGRSFHFPDFVLFIKFPYIWTHSSLPSELFGSPSAQFSYFPSSGVPSIQWNVVVSTLTLSNPSHTPDGETKSLFFISSNTNWSWTADLIITRSPPIVWHALRASLWIWCSVPFR